MPGLFLHFPDASRGGVSGFDKQISRLTVSPPGNVNEFLHPGSSMSEFPRKFPGFKSSVAARGVRGHRRWLAETLVASRVGESSPSGAEGDIRLFVAEGDLFLFLVAEGGRCIRLSSRGERLLLYGGGFFCFWISRRLSRGLERSFPGRATAQAL